MSEKSIAIVVYGEPGSGRNALTEEKYRSLTTTFIESGLNVDSVLYHDSVAASLSNELKKYKCILVWVNPLEQGNDRSQLDALLQHVASSGVFVSAHPDTILKLGTKGILYETRNEEFGTATRLFKSMNDLRDQFLAGAAEFKILKQYRGNGGQGVFKVDISKQNNDLILVTEATQLEMEMEL